MDLSESLLCYNKENDATEQMLPSYIKYKSLKSKIDEEKPFKQVNSDEYKISIKNNIYRLAELTNRDRADFSDRINVLEAALEIYFICFYQRIHALQVAMELAYIFYNVFFEYHGKDIKCFLGIKDHDDDRMAAGKEQRFRERNARRLGKNKMYIALLEKYGEHLYLIMKNIIYMQSNISDIQIRNTLGKPKNTQNINVTLSNVFENANGRAFFDDHRQKIILEIFYSISVIMGYDAGDVIDLVGSDLRKYADDVYPAIASFEN